MRLKLPIYIGLLLTAAFIFIRANAQRPVTIEDCIEMVRVQQTYDPNDPTVVFSSDGRQFVTMVWRGNLKTNLNDYTLLLYDGERLHLPPKELLRVSFGYDSNDQHARPLKQFAFLTKDRLAALATLRGEPRQVIAIDPRTKAVTPLTKHPSAVLSFAATPDGNALVYAAHGPAEDAKKAALYRDGFSLDDRQAIGPLPIGAIATGDWFRPAIQYFLVSRAGAQPRKIYEARHGAPHFWVAPDGRRALVYPVVLTDRGTQTIGLIDMTSGKIEPLIPGDHPFSDVRWTQWARDSQSLLIFTAPYRAQSVLSEITLSTRQATSVRFGQGREWDPLGWTASGDEVILTRSGYARGGDPEGTLAILRRTANGWDGPNAVSRADSQFDLNARYYSGTNGRLIVGVKDDLSKPPELAAYDRESKRTLVLTRLNPQLRDLKLGEVTRVRWSGPYDKETSFGYLIKPVDYAPGKKYPLIIQLKDEGYYPEDNSFILDGTEQYSGAAIQVWANAGFMVLFTPSPLSVREVIESQKEDEHITAHVESALDMLESQGMVDRSKVAIAGWSRAGWWTEAIVAHAKTRFAAASNIDNVEYNLNQYILGRYPQSFIKHWGGILPWGDTAERWREQAIDFKYDKAQTPRLIEAHGYSRIMYFAETYAALKTAKIPVEFYLYPDAPHNLKSPFHRLRSLSTHTDWFRFWLQGYEDPAPEKRPQYARWRKMREEWESAKASAAQAGSKK